MDQLSENPTFQEVFDFGLKKIIEQGRPSVVENGNTCLYRGSNNTKCIVGHMIPESENDFAIHVNSEGLNSILSRNDFPRKLLWMCEQEMSEFLGRLQQCHDHASTVWQTRPEEFLETFKANMARIASQWNLKYEETK